MSHYCPTCRDEYTGLGDGADAPYAALHTNARSVEGTLVHYNPVTREPLWLCVPEPASVVQPVEIPGEQEIPICGNSLCPHGLTTQCDRPRHLVPPLQAWRQQAEQMEQP